jgi:EAL domain-containing protein (putative c-di-GMP-specific phosphodiesterase class I)
MQRLHELDVRYAQGYLIGKAAPASEVLSGAAARGPAG